MKFDIISPSEEDIMRREHLLDDINLVYEITEEIYKKISLKRTQIEALQHTINILINDADKNQQQMMKLSERLKR